MTEVVIKIRAEGRDCVLYSRQSFLKSTFVHCDVGQYIFKVAPKILAIASVFSVLMLLKVADTDDNIWFFSIFFCELR